MTVLHRMAHHVSDLGWVDIHCLPDSAGAVQTKAEFVDQLGRMSGATESKLIPQDRDMMGHSMEMIMFGILDRLH